MKKISKIRHIRLKLFLLIGAGVFAIFFSQTIGKTDFGFRIQNIDVELSQKFPPAIAYEILEEKYGTGFEQKNQESSASPQETIPLMVGYPDIEPVQLEEMAFGVIESTSTIRSRNSENVKFDSLEFQEEIFSEEEKQRLSVAKRERGLQIDDLMPRHEVSFEERAQRLIKQNIQAATEKTIETMEPQASGQEAAKETSRSQIIKNTTLIKGEIEFVRDGSLAMTDQHFIDVRRFEEGIPKEVAQVDLSSGTFSIGVSNLKGVIIGRLTNQKGGVEGEGLLSVADLAKMKSTKLILKRLTSRDPVKAVSAYDKHHQGIDDVVTLASSYDGNNPPKAGFSPNSLSRDSDFVAEARTAHHRPTISTVSMTTGSELMLLPDRMLKGLVEILDEQNIQLDLDKGDSLIWGSVIINGKPVEGATIIPGQGRVSYFGGFYLPDQTRQQTSENGMFAIVAEQPGWNELFVELPDGRSVHVNALVYPGKVTQVSAEIPTEVTDVTLRSFDAFSGDPVRSRVEIQQLNDIVDTGAEGVVAVAIPKTKTLSFINATSEGPYENVRIAYHTLTDYIHIPLISKAWLDEGRSSLKVNDDFKTGSIVGFVQGEDFIVEVQNKETSSKILYFDQRGQFAQEGRAGGGFIVYNAEVDLPNIIIRGERTQREVARVVRPDSKFIQVVNASFD